MNNEKTDAALMLGGNVGDTLHVFTMACKLLTVHAGSLTAVSRIYESAPWGMEHQPWFRNQALLIETALSPLELLEVTTIIEKQLGRKEGEKNGPRVIDIDILLYNHLVMTDPRLTIPHPRMHLRKFNLEPLSEIAGNWVHPLLGATVSALNNACSDRLTVKVMTNDAAQ